jgi:hypothetical protein
MSGFDDSWGDMRRLRALTPGATLDERTADRMADGRMAIDDAPPGFQGVAGVIGELGAPATDAERVGGDHAVAAMVVVLALESGRSPSPGRTPIGTRTVARLAAVSTVGALALFGALGAAGALPGAAQDVASNVLSPLGLDVGNPNGNAEGHPDTRGQSTEHTQAAHADVPDDGTNPSGATPASNSSRTDGLTNAAGNVTNPTAADVLHTLATGTPGPGLGSSVSDAASGGNSQAPSDVPASLPPAASNGQGSEHVPTSVPPPKP